MEVYGDNSFIYKAFTYAKKYVPEGCKLYYNDYNEYIESKRDGIYNLVKDLHEKNLCDGVGMQSHLSTSYPSVQLYRAAVEKYASIGCDIQVTELDITLADGADFSKQAQMYKDLFDIYREYKDNISLVAFWGTNDETSWRSDGKPLIFSGYKPKEAYAKIIDGMDISTGTELAAATEECLICSDNNSQTVVVCRAGFFSYEITDISGRTCLSGNGNGFVNLNISGLPDGVYLAVVKTSDGKIFKEKIVKK
jgi:endo-1,4-beta-xylanase